MADTVFAQGEQKRSFPHGAKATPDLGCIRQTSQVPVTSDAAVPEQRPMDADRRRRRHRRRCLMSSCSDGQIQIMI